MSTIVVDASIALKWVLPEPDSSVAVALLNDWLTNDVRVIAPSWFAGEVANILYRRARRGTFTIADAHQALTGVLDVVERVQESSLEAHHAMDIADATTRAATYDAMYLALALTVGAEYWTADEIFFNATKHAYPQVRWMGAYSGQ
ncbi:MAG: type II toxin-antitoxin system VapC family toxin [Chloroflexota bacterium]|nr:type II toxin-antitoxin system VapC family toxin [Chloroflexota bacterium]